MANFEQAYKEVVEGHEGGYVNDPNDPGGETICGVARERCADWEGWAIVDAAKEQCASDDTLLAMCRTHPTFDALLRDQYKRDYWNVFYGDRWPTTMQMNATEVFDSQVNTGKGVTFLQHACNVMNRNGRDWPDIVIDGGFGPATWSAAKAAVQKRSPELLCKVQNLFQGIHYVRLMRKRPQQFERYIGWFNRI